MTDPPISTRPLNSTETLLKTKFDETIANQCDHMDKLGQQLIALELGISGLYATVLKLVDADKATLSNDYSIQFTFFFWFVALVLTVCSLTPRKWMVDTSIMKQDPSRKTKSLGIEDFFHKTAQYKRRLLIFSCFSFFAGTFSAVYHIF